MVLEGKRIILREFKKDDAKEYLKLSNEPAIKQYLPAASPDNLKECIELIDNYLDLDFINDFYFVIEDKSTHQLIGSILSYRISTFMLDTSYFIGKEFRGNGFILEALQVFIDYLSKNTAYKSMFFMIKNENLVSKKIMKKLDSKKIYEFTVSSSYEYQIKSAK